MRYAFRGGDFVIDQGKEADRVQARSMGRGEIGMLGQSERVERGRGGGNRRAEAEW